MLPLKSKGTETWDGVFSNCLKERTGFAEFKNLIKETSCNVPISGQACIDSLLRQDHSVEIDPRLLGYVEILLQTGKVDVQNVLFCVLQMFQKSSVDEIATAKAVACERRSYEACILQGLTHELTINGRDPVETSARTKAIHILRPLTAWLMFFSISYDDANALSGPALEVADAFGRLLATYINSLSLVGLLDGGAPKGIESHFDGCLHWTSTRLTLYSVQEIIWAIFTTFCGTHLPHRRGARPESGSPTETSWSLRGL